MTVSPAKTSTAVYDVLLPLTDDPPPSSRTRARRRCLGGTPAGGLITVARVRNATHELIGVSLALAAGHLVEAQPVQTGGLAVAAMCGARLPDIDQLGARIHRRNRLERRSLLVGAAGAALRLPLVAFAASVPHRALTHSALACVAAPLLAALVAAAAGPGAALIVGAGVGLGYAAHVAADACTPGGVKLWAPLSPKRVWLLPPRARIPTGSHREAAASGAAALAALAVVLLA